MTKVSIRVQTVDDGSVRSVDLAIIPFLMAKSSLYRKRNGCKMSRPQRCVAHRASLAASARVRITWQVILTNSSNSVMRPKTVAFQARLFQGRGSLFFGSSRLLPLHDSITFYCEHYLQNQDTRF